MSNYAILDLLPFGIPGCYFLLSGTKSQVPLHKFQRVKNTTQILTKFSIDESIRFFEDLNLNIESVKELHKICNGGVPSWLSSIYRLLKGGISVESVLNTMPEKLVELFELEWTLKDNQHPYLPMMLAIAAYDNRRHTVENLARLLSLKTDQAKDALSSLKFIEIDEKSFEISFVSESFRKFAGTKLKLKNEVQDILIKDLLNSPDSNASLSYLTGYLEEAGRYEDVITYLSPEHISKMAEIGQSLVPVMQKTELGISASTKLKRDADLLRFGIQKSILSELDKTSIWRSEIEALIAIEDYDSALSLAQANILKEERLHLLSVIYRKKKEKGLPSDEILKELIHNLYGQIDPHLLGEKGIDIASDLIFCAPDLAIDLVEKSTEAKMGENALDWAFAKLSISAQLGEKDSTNNEVADNTSTIERIHKKIRDPKAIRFSNSLRVFVNDYSGEEVIAESEKLDSTTEKLFIIRQWTKSNYKRNDALEVVQYALKHLIKTTEYAPNARVFREIASPLVHANDKDKVKILIGIIDSQKSTVEALGPTEEYIWLSLILAEAQYKYDSKAGCNRIIEIYCDITSIQQLEIKATCLARLVVCLDAIDPELVLEKQEGIHSIANDDLSKSVNEILLNSARQFQALR